jgi:hypothetical protein
VGTAHHLQFRQNSKINLLGINPMANITLKDLANFQDNGSFIQDLSEDQTKLQGGMCAFSTDENSRGCSDVIINFPEKFNLIKFIPKRK